MLLIGKVKKNKGLKIYSKNYDFSIFQFERERKKFRKERNIKVT